MSWAQLLDCVQAIGTVNNDQLEWHVPCMKRRLIIWQLVSLQSVASSLELISLLDYGTKH